MLPDQASILDALRATWPSARSWRDGALLHADGAGGGKRVSATRLAGDLDEARNALTSEPLVMVPDGAGALDAHLAPSHTIVDPTGLYAVDAASIAERDPEIYVADAPVAAMRRVWAEGGVGAERLAVMDRAEGPKAFLLARAGNGMAGVAFVAVHGTTAMMHAVHVAERLQRRGHGTRLARGAADWALQQGATILALATVRANSPARALYEGLGFAACGGYHYRALQ